MKQLSDDAIAVLSERAEVRGNSVVLTSGQLPRKLYEEVNAALEALGGAWNRKAKAHLFEADPAEALAEVLVDGGFHDKKRDLEQFDTPRALAEQIVDVAQVMGCSVLEPSAGVGAIVRVLRACSAARIRCIETDWARSEVLRKLRDEGGPCAITVSTEDFLSHEVSATFDRVVMNPPFSKGKDIDHVTHAVKFLGRGGKLVSIMSAGVEFRQDRKAKAFRQLVADMHGTVTRLPEKSFRSSGTDVRTVLVSLRKD